MEHSLEELYPTRLLTCRWQETETLNAALKDAILEKREYSKGIKRSNAARCWHSENDLFAWDVPAVKELNQRFVDAFHIMAKEYKAQQGATISMRTTAWAMVSNKGDYANYHTHPNAHFAGVYYVDTGGENEHYPQNGAIEFPDPRGGGVQSMTLPGLDFTPRAIVQPQAGYLLVFPAWFGHMVHPHMGPRPRIAVACNAKITGYDASKRK